GTTFDFFSLAGKSFRCAGFINSEDVARNDECCSSDDGRYGNEVCCFVELFKPMAEAFVELTCTGQCCLSTKSTNSTSTFECFETVMFTVPVVDLCKQAIFHLSPGARGLEAKTCLDFIHARLEPFTVCPGSNDLFVVLPRPFTADKLGNGCGFIGFG